MWAVAALLVGQPSGVAVGVSVGCALLVAGAGGRWPPAAVLLTCVAAIAGSCAWRLSALEGSPLRDLAEQRAPVAVDAVVAADARVVRSRHGTESAVVHLDVRRVSVESRTVSGRFPVIAFLRDDGAGLTVGRRLLAHGRLQPSTESDVVAVLQVDQRGAARPGARWWTAADRVRDGVRHAVRRAPPDARALVPALVDGDDSQLSDAVSEEFRRAGLTHLLAVSGTNLTIVLVMVVAVGRAFGVGRRRLVAVGFLAVIGFVLLARPDPSVLRAAAMGSVGLVAVAVGGRSGLRALSTAVVVLLFVDPWLARAPGFVLSVCATAGILIAANPMAARFRRWMPQWCAVMIAVPLAAQCACLPAVVALSGEVSIVGVAANIVAAPLVAPATIAGLLGGLIDLVHGGVATLPGTVAGWCASGIVAVAHVAAGFAGAAVPWPAPWWVLLGLAPLVMGAVWRLADRPAIIIGLALGVGLGIVRPPQAGWPPDGWLIVACDVGQGDATVINVGRGSAVLIDAGPDPFLIHGCLRRLRVDHLPLAVITHAHADHLGGWAGALRGRSVGTVLHGPSGGPGRMTALGDRFRIGSLVMDVLHPPADAMVPDEDDGAAMNNASVVVRARLHGVTVLLVGDAEPEAQEEILDSGVPIAADVLKFPHHGSGNQSPEFLRAVGAGIATISVGTDNTYGHPSPDALRMLAAQGAEWRRTDLNGDIAIVLDNGRLRVVTHR